MSSNELKVPLASSNGDSHLEKLRRKADAVKSQRRVVVSRRGKERPTMHRPALSLDEQEYQTLQHYCYLTGMGVGAALRMMVREYLQSLDFEDRDNPLVDRGT